MLLYIILDRINPENKAWKNPIQYNEEIIASKFILKINTCIGAWPAVMFSIEGWAWIKGLKSWEIVIPERNRKTIKDKTMTGM